MDDLDGGRLGVCGAVARVVEVRSCADSRRQVSCNASQLVCWTRRPSQQRGAAASGDCVAAAQRGVTARRGASRKGVHGTLASRDCAVLMRRVGASQATAARRTGSPSPTAQHGSLSLRSARARLVTCSRMWAEAALRVLRIARDFRRGWLAARGARRRRVSGCSVAVRAPETVGTFAPVCADQKPQSTHRGVIQGSFFYQKPQRGNGGF